jgi:hypothetical protein
MTKILSPRRVFLFVTLLCALRAGAAPFPPPADLAPQPLLPDPLYSFDGHPVETKAEWLDHRRPELEALFQHYMYGWLPPRVKVQGKTTYVDRHFFNGKATLRLATVTIGKVGKVQVHLLMVIPNQRTRPAPVFLGMNFSGNHTLVNDTNVPLPYNWMPTNIPRVRIVNHRATDEGRGRQVDTWALEQTIDRGYAVATYYCGDVELDRPNPEGGVREVIHPAREPDDWGTIAAWAWGMQRVMDYLSHDRDIDAKRIALVGHSRFGKATLLAGAFDDRAALVIPLQAGCGGTAPSRGRVGESVKQINDRFPDWFDGVFKEFNDHPERLPFDQNALIALCAPRPVLLGGAEQDTWTNPRGAFTMLQSATRVYRLMGVEGLSATNFPPDNRLVGDRLGYFIRPGKHAMTREDWKFFLDFADQHLR